jgi:hypothetical protein
MPGPDSPEIINDAMDILNDEGTNEEVEVDEPEDDLNGNVNLTHPTAGEDDEEPEVIENDDEPEKDDPEPEADDKKGDEIPHYQDIKAKYPNFFKEFPGVKAAYFFGRDAQAVFGSIENVKRAGEMLDDYQEISRDLFAGKVEPLLGQLKQAKKLEAFSENFLSDLEKTDQNQYFKVVEPVIANMLRQVLKEGTNRKDQNLINAAKLLSREVFSTTEIPEFKKKTLEPDPRVQELEGKLTAREEQVELGFIQDINTNGKALIDREINKLIPKEVTPYQRKLILREAHEEIAGLMQKDQAYLASQRPLWQGARRAGYVGDWKNQILRAALARAKQSVNSVTKKHIMEFTGKASARTHDTGNSVRRGDPPSGSARATGSNIKPIRAKDIDTRKTSALDILNDRITYKK